MFFGGGEGGSKTTVCLMSMLTFVNAETIFPFAELKLIPLQLIVTASEYTEF